MSPERRLQLCAPSEWDVAVSPELAALFVLDAAIVAAERIFSTLLDPSSSDPGGTDYPPTRALLETLRILRCHIREHRVDAQIYVESRGANIDSDNDISEEEGDCLPF
jgi:hypothetical protein